MSNKSIQFSEYNRRAYDANVALYADVTYEREDERNLTEKYFTKHDGKLLIGGIGGGRTAEPLLKKGFKVTGVDIAPGMIEVCRRKFGSDMDLRVMDIQHTDFADETFDYIFLPFHTISYVDDVWKTANEMRRILKPDGVLIVSAVNNWYVKNILDLKVLKGKNRLTNMGRTTDATIWTHHFSLLDARRFRRIFSTVDAFGRMNAANLQHLNWKDRMLATFPFFDKSLYFVCTK